MERGQGGEVDNDIGSFVNDSDDDYHSESELHDPYYCAPTVDMTSQPASTFCEWDNWWKQGAKKMKW
jgi:hypothetical protein